MKELLIIAGVVAVAFFTPQILFFIRDRILYNRLELSLREGMDVEVLSSSYEKSLYRRMADYAEGLAAGENFYVTSRNLAVEQELYDFLYGGTTGTYRETIRYLLLDNIIPGDLEYDIEQWKQYVIYSDNYAKGVNFILWYIELKVVDDIRLKLLVDAESGTLYALKLENCMWVDYGYGQYDIENGLNDEEVIEGWLLCSNYYEVYSSEEDLLGQIWESLEGTAEDEAEEKDEEKEGENHQTTAVIISDGAENLSLMMNWGLTDKTGLSVFVKELAEYAKIQFDYSISDEDFLDYVMNRIQVSAGEGDMELFFKLYYEGYSLEVLFKRRGRQEDLPEDIPGAYRIYPDTIMGVRQIYEMIPEFS